MESSGGEGAPVLGDRYQLLVPRGRGPSPPLSCPLTLPHRPDVCQGLLDSCWWPTPEGLAQSWGDDHTPEGLWRMDPEREEFGVL